MVKAYACVVLTLFSSLSTAQQTVTKDPTAISVLQQAVAAMGGSVPSDSTASGTVTTTAGALTESGPMVILTRGLDQSSEQVQTPSGPTTNYSLGNAAQVQDGTITSQPLELAATAQTPYFPLQLLSNILNNPDSAFSYVGMETLNGITVHHVQYWNSFTSTPPLAALSSLSQRDIWIDATSNLPVQISAVMALDKQEAPRLQTVAVML